MDFDTGITIICLTCYINGSVSGFLTINDDFNITRAIDGVENEVKIITSSALEQIQNFTETVVKDISKFELSNIPSWPTLDIDFNVANLNTLPSVQGSFQFDALELYLDLDLKMAAGVTYTLNLYTSETVAGFSIPDLEVGAIFSATLILISKVEIDITGGFHIKLDDGLALDLELFSKNIIGVKL